MVLFVIKHERPFPPCPLLPSSGYSYTWHEQMDGEDYVLLHHRAYELLEAWYGGGPRFKRWVISLGNGARNELMVELFPVK